MHGRSTRGVSGSAYPKTGRVELLALSAGWAEDDDVIVAEAVLVVAEQVGAPAAAVALTVDLDVSPESCRGPVGDVPHSCPKRRESGSVKECGVARSDQAQPVEGSGFWR